MSEQEPQRGVKRKRQERDTRVVDLDKKLPSKLHHCLKEVTKAAKKAKTFETQKLVKKLKQLRTKDSEQRAADDAAAELEVLKHLNVDILAQVALRSKIKKDRMLSENEYMNTAISKELSSASNWDSAVPGTPAAKVQARVLSSKYLAVETSHIIEVFRSIIQPSAPTQQIDRAASPSADLDVETNVVRRPSSVGGNVPNGIHTQPERTQPERTTESDDENEVDGGWESGSVGGDEDMSNDELDSSDRQHASSDNSAESDNASDDLSDHKPQAKVARSAGKQSSANNSASTFLPSLSVGYIRGDSDSDGEGSDAEAPEIQPRKNRRGQRARRAIWEKKYGRNANHKKTELLAETRNPRNSKLPQPSRAGPGQTFKNKVTFVRGANLYPRKFGRTDQPQLVSHDHRTGGPSQRISLQSEGYGDQRQPLHPSWEAKRKAREKQSAGIVPSQGKKIVFS